MFDQFLNLNVLKYGWPLIFLPILIHLFNRLRHRRIDWAATMFLRIASRKSTRYAKIRQYLVLLMRVLAVLALIMAISRPQTGTWLGAMMGGDPETILLVMDRSVSMEGKDASGKSKLEAARELMVETAQNYPEAEIWYLDSVVETPQRVENLDDLDANFDFNGTDAIADIPRLLETAAEWLKENKSGNAEVWIASDMQQNNWQPGASGRWEKVSEGLAGDDLPFTAHVQIMAKTVAVTNNYSIRVIEARQRTIQGNRKLELLIDFSGPENASVKQPATYYVNGREMPVNEVGLNYRLLAPSNLRQSVLLPLKEGSPVGWGYVQIGKEPEELADRFLFDDNPRDNRSYFVYGPGAGEQRSLVVGPDTDASYRLGIAADPPFLRPDKKDMSSRVSSDEFGKMDNEGNASEQGGGGINKNALVLWQDYLPAGQAAVNLAKYIKQGGVAVFFPPSSNSTTEKLNTFAGISWGQTNSYKVLGTNGVSIEYKSWEEAKPGLEDEEARGFRVASWKRREGPLHNSDNGKPLPVRDLITIRHCEITDQGQEAFRLMNEASVLMNSINGGAFTGSYRGAIDELQDTVREISGLLKGLSEFRWLPQKFESFQEQLVEPLLAIDPGKGEAAKEDVAGLSPFFDFWKAELSFFAPGPYVLAAYRNGQPLLARQVLGRGEMYFFTTCPDDRWSNVHENWSFVIMIQELIRTGSALGAGSYSVAHGGICGVYKPTDNSGLEPLVVNGAGGNYRKDANVYKAKNGEMVALNRTPQEDGEGYFSSSQEDMVKKLFGRATVHVNWETSEDAEGGMTGPQPLWRWFLAIMALVLVGEAILVLPRVSDEGVGARPVSLTAETQ